MTERKKRRPNTATIKRVMDWFDENGISVYGHCINLETGESYGGCMDLDTVEEVIKYAKVLQEEV